MSKSTINIAPGVLLALAVAVAAVLAAPFVARFVAVPAMVIALFIGIVLHPLAIKESFKPGITFSVKVILRWAVALLGVRIALNDIVSLGIQTAIEVIVSMIITVVAGIAFARLLNLRDSYGALAGAGTAVCGASATLATATVLPDYEGKEIDVAFVVVAVNTLSTIAMVLYPPLAVFLDFNSQTTGILLGATIHDVAQVVGAGYGVSEPVGNTAVIVKLSRVFLLLPVALGIGYYFARRTSVTKIPIPVFAMFFLVLCCVNSVMSLIGSLTPYYTPIKTLLVDASSWGLLIAIGALGLSTSITAIGRIGWRHVVVVTGTTIVMLAVIVAALRFVVTAPTIAL